MSRLDYVQRVLGEVSAALGISALSLGDDACTEVQVGGLWLTLMHATEPGEMLWLYVDLGPVPDRPETLRAVLRSAYTTWVQGEMTLAIDGSGRRVLGYSAIPLALLDATRLVDTLERLLGAGRRIARQLTGQHSATPGHESP